MLAGVVREGRFTSSAIVAVTPVWSPGTENITSTRYSTAPRVEPRHPSVREAVGSSVGFCASGRSGCGTATGGQSRIHPPHSGEAERTLYRRRAAGASHTAENGAGYDIWTSKQRLLLTNTGSTDRMRRAFATVCTAGGRSQTAGRLVVLRAGATCGPNPNALPARRKLQQVAHGRCLRQRVHDRHRPHPFPVESTGESASWVCGREDRAYHRCRGPRSRYREVAGSRTIGIGAEYRVAMTGDGHTGHHVEVYLYDLTSGGAGFVRTAAQNATALFDAALAASGVVQMHAFLLRVSAKLQEQVGPCIP